MNPDQTKQQLEDLLKQAGPVLKQAGQNQVVPPRVLQALRAVKQKKFPSPKELTENEMEALLLKVLAKTPTDGFDLTCSLEKAHFKIKGAGEGIIYGLLSKLESSGFLQAEWKDRGARMIKIYRLTDEGRGLLEKSESRIGQLSAWSGAVLAFD